MINPELLLAHGNTGRKFLSSSNKKTTTPVSTNAVTSYRSVLQENLANVSRPPVRSTNNFSSTNSQIIRGDANDDGVVNENDLDLLQLHLIGLGNVKNFSAADMDGDGKVTITDVSQLSLMIREQNESSKEVLKGDVNGDGIINQKDLDSISSRVININTGDKIDVAAADMNDDGEIDGIDEFKVKQLVKKHESEVQTLQGDSNGDGVVSEADHKNIADYLSGGNSTEDFIAKNSDINGDGEIDKTDLQGVRNILDGRKIDWDESKRRSGDVNGDNKVDINDAVTVLNYTNDIVQKKDFYWDNADVNHDGKIDLEDAVRIERFYNGKISSLDQDIFKINPPFEKAVITVDSNVYSDFYFIGKNSHVLNGDIVKVSGKSSDGTALEIIFTNPYGEESTGWISINNLTEYIPPVPPPVPPDIVYVRPTKTSDAGIEMIKGFEGFRDTAYKLPGEKYYTIGYGHTGSDVYAGMKISREQAEEFLRQDLIKAENYVKNYCAHLNLNQNQFDALVSFTFNCGPENLDKLLHGESGKENRPLEKLPEHMPYYRLDATKQISNGLVKRRAAEVALFNTPIDYIVPPPPVPPPYPSWDAVALRKLPVYEDENLTVRNGVEEVWANDPVTVLDENDKAYLIRYPASNTYKERWVSKDIFVEPDIPRVPEALQNLIDKYEGKIWEDETTGKGNYECKDFAAYIFRQLYNIWYIGSTKSKDEGKNYMISLNNPSKVGIRGEYEYLTKYNVKSLFANAQPGDFVQMRRTHGGSHSAVVGAVTGEGVWFFEANAPDPEGDNYVHNKVKYQFHSWENLAAKNSGMSVYYAK